MIKNCGTSILPYNGTNITFELANGDVMVNLTDVAKAFPEKNLSTIVNSKEIKQYVARLAAIKNFIASDLLKVENGVGTWAHQKVALRVAQKLSPDFSIWVDTKLEELLTTGISTIRNDDEAILHAMQVLQQRVEASKRQLENAQKQIELQDTQLKAQAPKVEYADNVLNSVNTYTSTQMAKELDLRTAEQLHKLLKSYGIMIRQSGQWLLAAKYCGQNYTKTRTFSYTRQDGSQGTNICTVWTERGRRFLHQLMSKKGGAQ